MIGFSAHLVNTDYMRYLTQLIEQTTLNIDALPSPSIGTHPDIPGDQTRLEVNLINDNMSENVRLVAKLIGLQDSLTDNQYFNISIVKIVGDTIFDAWTVQSAKIDSLVISENRSPTGRLFFKSYKYAPNNVLDRSQKTLDLLNLYININRGVNEAHFYQIEHELLVTENDLKSLQDIQYKPQPVNPVLQAAFDKQQQKMIDSINKASADADAAVTDPVQKSFLQRLREMVGI